MNADYKISELFIYPVKSLGGISVREAEVTDRGLKYDRRWMLVDNENRFLTQRKFPEMALVNCELKIDNLEFTHKKSEDKFTIGLDEKLSPEIDVVVWDDEVKVNRVSINADKWFSEILGINCSLVHMPETSRRLVDPDFSFDNEITSLSDGYPFLIIGQSSLDDLNSKLTKKVPVNRFRPNFVFTGGEPFIEDKLKHFEINEIKFFGVKQCGRCVVTTINQDNAVKGEEPLRTLSSYRTINNKVMFGMNLIHKGRGFIHVGDSIEAREYR